MLNPSCRIPRCTTAEAMTLRIDGTNSQPLANPQGSPATSRQSETGVWAGASVQVAATADDLLTDSAEEITMSHSEHVESRKLEEREIDESPPLALPSIDSIIAYLDAAGRKNPQAGLEQFVEALKRNAGQPDGADPREEARRRFASVTEQFAALAYAAKTLEQEGGHDALLAQVHNALDELSEDSGAIIRADFNTIGAAAQFGAGDEDRIAAFQATYHDAVIGGQDLVGMLKGALARFGSNDYRGAVQTLIRALGDDLAATSGPSAPPARLNAVLQELYLMETLATMLDGCQALSTRMGKEQHIKPPPSAGDLLQDLVTASGERWSNAGRFGAIADKYGARSTESRIAFLTSVKHLVRDMPIKVFADTDARSNVIDATQSALDDAVALEEAGQ